MYHGYISPLTLLLKGLRAEGELRLANREIQCLVTEIPNRLDEGGGGGGNQPENLEKQLNIFRQFGLNPHISLIFHKLETRNCVIYQCLTCSYLPRISCSHKGRSWAYSPLQNASTNPPSLDHHQQRGP